MRDHLATRNLNSTPCQRFFVSGSHQVGFHPGVHGSVSDAIGTFRFLECPFGELLLRLQLAWTSVMASQVQHRSSFRGFETVDVALTRLAYGRFDSYDQGILRKHLHGATLTNAHAPALVLFPVVTFVANVVRWTLCVTGFWTAQPLNTSVMACLWSSVVLCLLCLRSLWNMDGL